MEKTNLKNLKTYKQIFYYLVNLAEMYPQYTIPQHFQHILRKKSDTQESYDWSNEKFLAKVESYYEELKEDLQTLKEEE